MIVRTWSSKNVHMPNEVWEKLDEIRDNLNKKNTGRKFGRGIAIEHLIEKHDNKKTT